MPTAKSSHRRRTYYGLPLFALLFWQVRLPAAGSQAEPVALIRLCRSLTGAAPAAIQAAVERFITAVKATGTPLLTAGHVTFIYAAQPGEEKVEVVGDLTGWSPRAALVLMRLAGTRLFTSTLPMARAARVEYQLRIDGHGTLDPWARGSSDNGLGGRNSCFTMPDYRDGSLAFLDPTVPHGRVDEFKLSDGRGCLVYRPPGYDASGTTRYPTLYLHDGAKYRTRARVTEIVDTLIARRLIRPILMVMVDPIQRNEEYSLSDAYVRLTVEELVPRIDGAYRTDPRPAARAVGGASMGGIAAAGLALEHPEVFGMALCQSGAYQIREGHVIRLAAKRAAQPIRFWIDVGRYDLDFGGDANLLVAARRFHAALRVTGQHRARYQEVPEGHNWTHWSGQLPDALKWLFRLRQER